MEATNEFQDWELLQSNSDSESVPVSSPKSPNNSLEEEIHASGGLIQVDYFSVEAENRHYGEDLGDDKSSGSDNPSWIDPCGLEENLTRYANKEPCEFWSDSSSERSEDRKFSDLHGISEMGFSQNEKKDFKFEGAGEILEEKGGKVEGLGSGGIELGFAVENCQVGVGGEVNLRAESEGLDEPKNENEKIGSGGPDMDEKKKSSELEKRGVVWWKMPMEFLKYCVFRMSPVWTISVAAAVMGFVILGRRLHKMKKKARGLEIKVTVDDKKVSQVMSRAARLNEAFSVVRRVPVIRPSLPAVGTTTTWPVMSLR